MSSQTIQKKIFIISFLFIPVLLLVFFVIYPSLNLLWMSFTSWDGISNIKEFLGLDNYIKMIFNSPNVWLSLKNNGIYFFVHLLFIPLELAIAVILDSKIKASNFFKSVVFLPYIVNGVAIAYAFSYFYSPYNGALNEILKAIGLGAAQQSWLGNEHIVNYSLAVISLWKYCGFHIIL
ncbi:MAG: carbohydrate ABC transporter permease, partial [Ruminiclostridium sp.]